ncbi:MAG TPA: pyruvate dehydrogenase (acetyl-transferring), homodimeric type, partial [Candidatus Eisenbacteria bacterium]|nr:pyruvate dehydrogenase (acetyl-transferring), homodimeric type [Candidatus Eisenbacteria bacterium]
TESPKKSYVETALEKELGVFVAVSDYMKIVPDQIAPWVPGGLMTLGTDGFGRSDTRERLRRFFEVDAESTVIATLYALAEKGEIEREVVANAINDLGVDPEKIHGQII